MQDLGTRLRCNFKCGNCHSLIPNKAAVCKLQSHMACAYEPSRRWLQAAVVSTATLQLLKVGTCALVSTPLNISTQLHVFAQAQSAATGTRTSEGMKSAMPERLALFPNALTTPLPPAPSVKIFCMYGTGLPTERSYHYLHPYGWTPGRKANGTVEGEPCSRCGVFVWVHGHMHTSVGISGLVRNAHT